MTHINKALLEKYELGQCTEQERIAVCNWLENEDWDQLDMDSDTVEEVDQEMIWSPIEAFVDKKESPVYRLWLKPAVSIAASLLVILGAYYWTSQGNPKASQSASLFSQASVKQQAFEFVLGANSKANIDVNSGDFTLTGNVLFKPNKDIILQYGKQANLHFKAGETYYLSETKDPNKIIIVRKGEFTFLPAIVQKQIRKQFQIS